MWRGIFSDGILSLTGRRVRIRHPLGDQLDAPCGPEDVSEAVADADTDHDEPCQKSGLAARTPE